MPPPNLGKKVMLTSPKVHGSVGLFDKEGWGGPGWSGVGQPGPGMNPHRTQVVRRGRKSRYAMPDGVGEVAL